MPKEHRTQSCQAALEGLSIHHVEQEGGRGGKEGTGWDWMGWPAIHSSTSILKQNGGWSFTQFSSEYIYFSLSFSKLKICLHFGLE